jgi:hypothetical protein
MSKLSDQKKNNVIIQMHDGIFLKKKLSDYKFTSHESF